MVSVPTQDAAAVAVERPADLGPAQAVRRERVITEITDRLAARFPQVVRTELDRRTRDTYTQFTTSRVQGYLPILVERLVRRSLEGTTTS